MAFERDDISREREIYRGQNRDRGNYGAQSSSYRGQSDRFNSNRDNHDDRGFFDRAGDEVRSWFGDEDAERRRERDNREYARGDTGFGGSPTYEQTRRDFSPTRGRADHDPHYAEWRQRQIDALDRDYDEYRRNNQSDFDTKFGGYRQQRQTQRQMLDAIEEHQEVVGSDGEHVGKIDKIKGDRLILAKNDPDAGGHHHSIPSSWLASVQDGKVTISKSAEEAKRVWRDEDRNQAFFSDDQSQGQGPRILNRSFSGTY